MRPDSIIISWVVEDRTKTCVRLMAQEVIFERAHPTV